MAKKTKLPDLDSSNLAVITVVLDRTTERVRYFHPAASRAEAYSALTAAQAAAEEKVIEAAFEDDA